MGLLYVATRKPQPVSTGIVRFVRIVKCPFKKQGAEDRRPLRPGDLGVQVTLTVGGARYPLLLPVGAIPAPVPGYSVAFGRGRARP